MYIVRMDFEDAPAATKGSIFQLLSFIFKKHEARCVLVGGYALIANKVQRMTFDIDFILTPEDYSKIEPDLFKAGYSVLSRQKAFVQLKNGKRGMRDLDFLIGDQETISGLIAQGKTISIAGEPFIVPSPMHLIAMKLHSMVNNKNRESKDLPDVINLMISHSIDPAGSEIREMFRKYNAMHLMDKIIQTPGLQNNDKI